MPANPITAPGQTRSASRPDHLLQTPDSFVRTPLPGLTRGMAVVHAAPRLGAGFSMMTVELEPAGKLAEGSAQRFLYVLEGELTLTAMGETHALLPGGYAFCPAGCEHTLTAAPASRVAVIDKPFQPLPARAAECLQKARERAQPWFLVGHEDDAPAAALHGDADLQVRALLPDSIAFDFACNTMTYAPGAALSQVEVHVMEHGLLMLAGGGVYRLGESWYPVGAGDFVWMAPFCPQWFGALGKTPAKYLIYKDWNRSGIT